MKASVCPGCNTAIRASNADVLWKRLKRHAKKCAGLFELAKAKLREGMK